MFICRTQENNKSVSFHLVLVGGGKHGGGPHCREIFQIYVLQSFLKHCI